jgi:hypothetical protein
MLDERTGKSKDKEAIKCGVGSTKNAGNQSFKTRVRTTPSI